VVFATKTQQIMAKCFDEHYAKLMQLAEAGHSGAMHALSLCYASGLDGPPDRQQSFAWLLRSAEAGCQEAFAQVGAHYASGIGTPKNDLQAFYYYLRAAKEANDLDGYFLAAEMYLNPDFVMHDQEAGIQLLQTAAEAGQQDALCTLGIRYVKGHGVAVDYDAAYHCFAASADTIEIAKFNLAVCYTGGFGVDKDVAKAYELFYELALAGVKEGQREVGRMQMLGYGVSADQPAAMEWLRKAAAQGDEQAIAMLE